jgi:hypothetical protein
LHFDFYLLPGTSTGSAVFPLCGFRIFNAANFGAPDSRSEAARDRYAFNVGGS